MDSRFFMQYLGDTPEDHAYLNYIFDRACRERILARTYYDGTVQTKEDFIKDVLRPGSLPFLVLWEGRPAGFTWFNSIEGRSARGHFLIFRDAWGKKRTIPIGRGIFTYIMTRADQDGYLFDVILGLTPVKNVLAWRLALMCGAVSVGVIPHGAYIAAIGKSEDALLMSVTRKSLGLEDQ